MNLDLIDRTNYQSFKYKESVHQDFLSICAPLRDLCGISGFSYKRLYPDGRYFSMSQCLVWEKFQSQYVHENDLTWDGGVQLVPKDNGLNPVPILWPQMPNSPLTHLIYAFDGLTGISFAKYSRDFTDYWEFAGSNNNSALRVFLPNITRSFNNSFDTLTGTQHTLLRSKIRIMKSFLFTRMALLTQAPPLLLTPQPRSSSNNFLRKLPPAPE